MPGPLPTENPRRRNAPTIPTTKLPVSGRSGRAPVSPRWVTLGKPGKAWWSWAWKTPQACAWGPGHEVMIARRASLEDDLAVLGQVESLDFAELLDNAGAASTFRSVIQRLAGLAGGRLAICREMRELEDRLGLTPKGMAALRWTIVPDAPAESGAAAPAGVTRLDDRRDRLTS